jgi:hypothetical protein
MISRNFVSNLGGSTKTSHIAGFPLFVDIGTYPDSRQVIHANMWSPVHQLDQRVCARLKMKCWPKRCAVSSFASCNCRQHHLRASFRFALRLIPWIVVVKDKSRVSSLSSISDLHLGMNSNKPGRTDSHTIYGGTT